MRPWIWSFFPVKRLLTLMAFETAPFVALSSAFAAGLSVPPWMMATAIAPVFGWDGSEKVILMGVAILVFQRKRAL